MRERTSWLLLRHSLGFMRDMDTLDVPYLQITRMHFWKKVGENFFWQFVFKKSMW